MVATLGGVEIVVRYPTFYIRPEHSSRVVREVVYKELERLTQYRANPDVAVTADAIYSMYKVYRSLDYSIPEMLSAYQTLDRRGQERLRVESIPWELVPKDILERCLDSNMELRVTSELMGFLGFSCGDTIFDRYEYPSRLMLGKADELIASPTYRKETGKLAGKDYLFYDEDSGVYRRALTRQLSYYRPKKTVQELEFTIEMFNSSNEFNSLGLRPRLLAATIWSIQKLLLEYRKNYFSSSYLDRLTEKSVEELRKERLENEREYAISLRGKYDEDTSVLWRYGQLSD